MTLSELRNFLSSFYLRLDYAARVSFWQAKRHARLSMPEAAMWDTLRISVAPGVCGQRVNHSGRHKVKVPAGCHLEEVPAYPFVIPFRRMIAEIFPEHYDVQGQRVFTPGKRLRGMGFRPSAPMGSNVTGSLSAHCKDFAELRKFLCACRWRNTREDRRDHWQAPEEFEKSRSGDCVDFGLWTWRQVLDMGCPARFVGGKCGKYGEGHAWVMFQKNGSWFLLEPQARGLGLRMPRISTLRYHPKVSVGWDGEKVTYFEHEDLSTEPAIRNVPMLVAEWVWIWARFWIQFSYRYPLALVRRFSRRLPA